MSQSSTVNDYFASSRAVAAVDHLCSERPDRQLVRFADAQARGRYDFKVCDES